MTEETPTREDPKGWALMASVLKAILTGNRKEDKNARVTAALLAVIAILGGVVVRGDNRTDRLIEGLQESSKAADKRTAEAIGTIADLTKEIRLFRESLEAPPAPPKRFEPKPVRQTR
jgi:hypothetical protein